MILRTANGSLMKVTEMEGLRILDEHPFDYYYEPDACEICVKDSWTVCDVLTGKDPGKIVRMCHSCYIEKGGTEEGWDNVVTANMLMEEAKKNHLNEFAKAYKKEIQPTPKEGG